MDKKNILVIRFSALGDVAMTVPVVAEVAKKYDANITILTKNAFGPLFATLENITVFSPDFNQQHKGFFGLWRLFRELRQMQKWNAVVDLHDVLRTKVVRLLFCLSGTKVAVINKNRSEKKQLTRRKNKKLHQVPFVQDEYAKTFERIGFPVEVKPVCLYDKNIKLPGELVNITGEKSTKWIGIAPFAKHETKMYPLACMEKVIEYFSSNNIKIFLFGGGKHETDILNRLQDKYSNTISLAGKVSFENELRIMSHLDCVLTMDSGNMHLANLVNVPVVSVWGATHPYTGFLSKGNLQNEQVQLQLDCRPCSVFGNKSCYKGTNECLNINSQVIIEAIERKIL